MGALEVVVIEDPRSVDLRCVQRGNEVDGPDEVERGIRLVGKAGEREGWFDEVGVYRR